MGFVTRDIIVATRNIREVVVPMIYDVVLLEARDIVVRQVECVVGMVAARVILQIWAATVTVIASWIILHLRFMAVLILLRLVLLVLLLRRPTLQVHVLKQEDLAESSMNLNAVVGDLLSAIQVMSIPTSLVVQAPIAFNLQTINQYTVGKIEDTVV
jgi:hypothetical protein